MLGAGGGGLGKSRDQGTVRLKAPPQSMALRVPRPAWFSPDTFMREL